MATPIMDVRELSKLYRVGALGGPKTLQEATRRLWERLRGGPWIDHREPPPVAESRRGPRPDTFWAIRDISFRLEEGDILGIIGGNGAGKSTLLKVLSRITEPTEGEAVIRGRVASMLEVGTGFHPELSGRENILLNGAMLGMTRREILGKFDEIVAFSEVGDFIDTPVKRYSSGMYVRLAFAVAAHLDPDVLIVDEVLAVGDAAFQRRCLGKMGDVARTGRTILFVSHNMAAVESLCHRVVCLRDGRTVDDGRPADVVARYLTTAHASLVQQAWDDPATAPGNESVRLRRARVCREDGSPADDLTTRTPFRLEFEYWNLRPGAHLNLSLQLYDARGTLVFSTVPRHGSASRGRPRPVGLFRDVCRIPGDLLNDGDYRVELLIVQDECTVLYRHEDVLTFNIRDSLDLRGAWYGHWAGVVRPVLEWDGDFLGEGAGARGPSAPASPAGSSR